MWKSGRALKGHNASASPNWFRQDTDPQPLPQDAENVRQRRWKVKDEVKAEKKKSLLDA